MLKLANCTLLLIIAGGLIASCTSEKRYRTPTGLLYKLYTANEQDSLIRMGQTVKYQVVQVAGDSVIENTYDKMPKYWQVMPGFENRYNPLEVFDYGIREGDSVITIQNVDSMVARRILDSIPKWMKSGDEWITHLKVVKVFDKDSALQADKQQEAIRVTTLQQRLGMGRIGHFLEQHKLKAENSADSLYITSSKTGIGQGAAAHDQLKLHFTLSNLGGKKLNSTRDSTSQGPVTFALGSGYMPPFIEQRLEGITAGSQVKYYVPGVLLFGPEPNNSLTRVDDDWIIDMEILAVQKQDTTNSK